MLALKAQEKHHSQGDTRSNLGQYSSSLATCISLFYAFLSCAPTNSTIFFWFRRGEPHPCFHTY